jgi:hypothetical protein
MGPRQTPNQRITVALSRGEGGGDWKGHETDSTPHMLRHLDFPFCLGGLVLNKTQ